MMSALLVSCDDFLDVHAKSEKLESELFKTAKGFEDAIYGVYGSLQQQPMYGMYLTWAVPEVLAQNLRCGSNTVEALAKYNYTDNDNVRSTLASIWQKTYQTIGYANNILKNLEENHSPDNLPLYDVYRAEMLGVRAMLHFDMLRLFASTNMSSPGIPYATTYDFSVKPFETVEKVYGLVEKDLLEADSLLGRKDVETLVYPRTNNDYFKFMNYRETHMNRYAIEALLARVYWMKGDMPNAAKYAELVINSKKFELANGPEVVNYLAGKLSPKETIFGVYSNSFIETSRMYLYDYNTFASYNPYYNGEQTGTSYPFPYTELYNTDHVSSDQDYRLQHFSPGIGYCTFLKLIDRYELNEQSDPRDDADALIPGITLIHLSEMYLIAAEALLNSNYDLAVRYFDDEIQSRGLAPFERREKRLDAEMIYNEYCKEMFGEGQIWFNMKRLNRPILSNMENRTIEAGDRVYVLPIPADENEYRD